MMIGARPLPEKKNPGRAVGKSASRRLEITALIDYDPARGLTCCLAKLTTAIPCKPMTT